MTTTEARPGRVMATFQKANTGFASKVIPGTRIRLADYDSDAPATLARTAGEDLLANLLDEMADLQQSMFGAAQQPTAPTPRATTPAATPFTPPLAQPSNSLLVVIQGTDGAGKDSLIKAVFNSLNPLWLRASGMKAATFDDVGRDFLYRSHQSAPRPGWITVQHRSYYEGVLSERVHQSVPDTVWQARYDEINSYEAVLSQANTIVLKFFLNISKAEQKRRLIGREALLNTAWKLSPVDWQERRLWDDYQMAFEDMLMRCSTDAAPWFIVPADQKWYAALSLADAIVSALRPYRAGWQSVLADMQAEQLAAINQVGRV
jgi:polyphosphate kinase 2 (PPK2 family)